MRKPARLRGAFRLAWIERADLRDVSFLNASAPDPLDS